MMMKSLPTIAPEETFEVQLAYKYGPTYTTEESTYVGVDASPQGFNR